MATQYTAQDFTDLLKIPKGYKLFKTYVHTGKGNSKESAENEVCGNEDGEVKEEGERRGKRHEG